MPIASQILIDSRLSARWHEPASGLRCDSCHHQCLGQEELHLTILIGDDRLCKARQPDHRLCHICGHLLIQKTRTSAPAETPS